MVFDRMGGDAFGFGELVWENFKVIMLSLGLKKWMLLSIKNINIIKEYSLSLIYETRRDK